jgi:hypothetical protein
MAMPVLINRAEEETLQMAEGKVLNQVLEMAQPA